MKRELDRAVHLRVIECKRTGKTVRLTKEELDKLHPPMSATKAVRAFCVECMGGSYKEVQL